MKLGILEILTVVGLLGDAQLPDVEPREVLCLAKNIYHEARGEGFKGQLAVAHVTLNRVEDTRWPDSICEVVYQPSQFSWTLTKPGIKNPVALENAMAVAVSALSGLSKDPTDGATHYFNHNVVTPRWSRVFETVAVIGDHTFKRQPQ